MNIEELNSKLVNYTTKYFENINFDVMTTEKQGMLFCVPTMWVSDVKINNLSITDDIQQINISNSEQVKRTVYPIRPLVRVAVSTENIELSLKDDNYFKATLTGIINSVQRAWEKEFGSYKAARYGSTFFNIKPLVWDDSTETAYIDFYGDWASNEEAR